MYGFDFYNARYIAEKPLSKKSGIGCIWNIPNFRLLYANNEITL